MPDILEIYPLDRPPDCTLSVPGSKSITNRALILAALAPGKCTLRGALWADDTQVMVDALGKLGFEIHVRPDPHEECNRTIEVTGHGGKIPAAAAELYVGNAGTAARFLTALVCLGQGDYRIVGDPRMHERPMGDLFAALGIEGTRLPATIRARGLRPGRITVSAKDSSQFASALLLTGHDVHLAEAEEPHGYIEMTRRMMREFSPDFTIEPDMSSASYFVAAQFVTGGSVRISGWPASALQIDASMPRYLPPPSRVSRLSDLGDSVMALAVAALFGLQPMTLVHAERMREQECDRITAMVTEFRRVGATVQEHQDGFTIWPARPGQLHGADIQTYSDHRMAMSFAVLGLKLPGLRIANPACVSKTFPNFFAKLDQLRAGARP
jgi:3-phosphoshikimate 1-carboxyvinyltransferase